MSKRDNNNMRKSLLLIVPIAFVLLAAPAMAVTPLTDCADLAPGITYELQNDILFNGNTTRWYCFNAAVGASRTLDMMGYTVYMNDSGPWGGIYGIANGGNNTVIRNGNFIFNGTSGYGIVITSYGGNTTITGIHVNLGGHSFDGILAVCGGCVIDNLTVTDSSFTGVSPVWGWDLDIGHAYPIYGCNNTFGTAFGGVTLNTNPCSTPPGTMKDYIVGVNCTQHSSAAYGSLVCSNNITIPADCANITTEAYTVIDPNYETGLNGSFSFTRYTCDPEGDHTTYCDNRYRVCSYTEMNAYPSVYWNDYAAGVTATSYHISVIPDGCIIGAGANFTMIGRLFLTCKSPTVSGITIDNTSASCTHTVVCFNSDIMEERFADCTSVLTPCTYGCYGGVCIGTATSTTTIAPLGSPGAPLIAMPTALSFVGLLLTPQIIFMAALCGIGYMFEQASGWKAKGSMFLGTLILGSVMLTYVGILPVWVGVAISLLCAVVLFRGVLGFNKQ
jgi:hypothetical protein